MNCRRRAAAEPYEGVIVLNKEPELEEFTMRELLTWSADELKAYADRLWASWSKVNKCKEIALVMEKEDEVLVEMGLNLEVKE